MGIIVVLSTCICLSTVGVDTVLNCMGLLTMVVPEVFLVEFPIIVRPKLSLQLDLSKMVAAL